jgi:hypothetical protein
MNLDFDFHFFVYIPVPDFELVIQRHGSRFFVEASILHFCRGIKPAASFIYGTDFIPMQFCKFYIWLHGRFQGVELLILDTNLFKIS